MKTVYIASDHAGFSLKNFLVKHLVEKGYAVHDLGPADTARCDYPDSAFAVTSALKKDESAFGILICGTGIGMSMAAQPCARHPGGAWPPANFMPAPAGRITTPMYSALVKE